MTKLGIFLFGIFAVFNVYADNSALEARISHLEQQLIQLKQHVVALEKQINTQNAVSPAPAVTAANESEKPLTQATSTRQLTLKRWFYRETKIKFNTYYGLDVELHNGFSQTITQIDARIKFSNQFGGHLYSVTITPDLRIAAGSSVVDIATQENRRLLGRGHQMRSLKPDEINANLLVRKIVFADGSSLDF